MEKYSSKPDTQKHIDEVWKLLNSIMFKIENRTHSHDASKLKSPELEYFDKYTPLLKTLVYGTEEYKKSLEELKPALDHHYSKNRHHPEHWEGASVEWNCDLISCMTLIDIIEMFCDWIAASKRTKNGDPKNSIEISCKRFNVNEQLEKIFYNTLDELTKG